MKNKKTLVTAGIIVAILVALAIVVVAGIGNHNTPQPTDPTTTVPTTKGTVPHPSTTQGTQPNTTVPVDSTTAPTDPGGPTDPTDPTGPDHTHSYTTETVAPTCTQAGLNTYTCECGHTYTEEIPAAGHNYKQIVTEPACDEEGYTTHTCTACADTFTDGHTGPLGHDYAVTKVEATCEIDGYTIHTCSRCGDSYEDDVVKATGHSYSDWTTTKEPTCDQEGSKERTCANCGETEKRSIGTTAHDWDETITPATCTEDGVSEMTCKTCGKQETTTLEALGHDWTDWEIIREATDTEDGERKHTCTICGEEAVEKYTNKCDHKWAEREIPPEGCTKSGYIEYYCTKCNYSYHSGIVTVEAPGHDWSDWETSKEPTETESGEKQRTCKACGEVETAALEPTGYESYVDPRVTVKVFPDGTKKYKYGDINVYDDRPTWGEPPSIWVNDDGSLTVVYYNIEGKRIEVRADVPPATYVRSLYIQEDGTYILDLVGDPG